MIRLLFIFKFLFCNPQTDENPRAVPWAKETIRATKLEPCRNNLHLPPEIDRIFKKSAAQARRQEKGDSPLILEPSFAFEKTVRKKGKKA